MCYYMIIYGYMGIYGYICTDMSTSQICPSPKIGMLAKLELYITFVLENVDKHWILTLSETLKFRTLVNKRYEER